MPGVKNIFESGEKSPVSARYELVGIDNGSTIFYLAGNRFRIELKKGGLFPYLTNMCKLKCVWRRTRADSRGKLRII